LNVRLQVRLQICWLVKSSELKLRPKSTAAIDAEPLTTPAPWASWRKLGALTTVPVTRALPHATWPLTAVCDKRK